VQPSGNEHQISVSNQEMQDHPQPKSDWHMQVAQSNFKQPKNRSKMWQCQHCSAFILTKGAISRHIRKVHGEKVMSCTKCDYITNKVWLLLYHLKKDHKLEKQWKEPRQCRKCSESYKSEASLAWHEETAHSNEAETRKLSVKEKNSDMIIKEATTSEGNLAMEGHEKTAHPIDLEPTLTGNGQEITVYNSETQDGLFGQLKNDEQNLEEITNRVPGPVIIRSGQLTCKKASYKRLIKKVICCTLCNYKTR
jgi:hypothetical protein